MSPHIPPKLTPVETPADRTWSNYVLFRFGSTLFNRACSTDDTDMQYTFTRAIADHMFRNYDGVLKVDGEVGRQKDL